MKTIYSLPSNIFYWVLFSFCRIPEDRTKLPLNLHSWKNDLSQTNCLVFVVFLPYNFHLSLAALYYFVGRRKNFPISSFWLVLCVLLAFIFWCFLINVICFVFLSSDKDTFLKIILGKDVEGTGIWSIFHGQSTSVRWRRRPLDSDFQTKPHFVDQTVALCPSETVLKN